MGLSTSLCLPGQGSTGLSSEKEAGALADPSTLISKHSTCHPMLQQNWIAVDPVAAHAVSYSCAFVHPIPPA